MSVKKIFLCLFLVLIVSFCAMPLASAQNVEYVYLGGYPIGIVLENQGLQICGKTEVITNSGTVIPSLEIDILPGDYLVSIANRNVRSIDDLTKVLSDCKDGEKIEIGVLRDNKIIKYYVTPVKESLSGKYKLGLMIQDGVSGIGTVTYVRKNGTFGALGHSIGDNKATSSIGKIFDCKIIGVKMPRIGEAGELQGVFNKSGNACGKIEKNNSFGIFGKVNNSVGTYAEVRLGNKDIIKEGKAYIYTCVDGNSPQKYEIEIIKAYDQTKPTTKSMVIKVTDQKLLEKSGGIVQGMSGSPIVQGGYLIGAVTHVFTGDSTKGYGLYVDWMVNN